MPTIILAVICVVLIFILYIVSGGWKKYGGLLGIVKWIRATAYGAKHDPSVIPSAGKKPVPSPDEQVTVVLRQIYQDFEEKYERLLERIEQLEASSEQMSDLNAREEFVAKDTDLQRFLDVEPDDDSISMSRQDLYFRILDLLESGKSEEEIATLLAVDRDDILYVRRIMSGPIQH